MKGGNKLDRSGDQRNVEQGSNFNGRYFVFGTEKGWGGSFSDQPKEAEQRDSLFTLSN